MLLLGVLQLQGYYTCVLSQSRVLDIISFRFTLLTFFFCFLELIRPSKEQLATQAELQRLQASRRVDQDDFNNQKQVLQMQLHSEVSAFTPDV